ncbi:MAG: DUF2500 domain-containing protein [Ruminococcaceae bacterium]|nr:DUF2500 domain-containing protein [Oscillospiraceae bacterium]
MPENILEILGVSLVMLLGFLPFIKMAVNRFAPVKTSKAVAVDKTVIQRFSKYAGDGKAREYVIVFSLEGKKKSFSVSQFSYNGYKINEKGTLTYQGNRIISFK